MNTLDNSQNSAPRLHVSRNQLAVLANNLGIEATKNRELANAAYYFELKSDAHPTAYRLAQERDVALDEAMTTASRNKDETLPLDWMEPDHVYRMGEEQRRLEGMDMNAPEIEIPFSDPVKKALGAIGVNTTPAWIIATREETNVIDPNLVPRKY